MHYLSELKEGELRGKRVLLRLDLNVPIEEGVVRDDFRIQRSLPTIQKLQSAGAQVTVLAHLGKKGASITPVAEYLQKLVGPIKVLENLRLNPGEEVNSPELARELAVRGDLYVNEAFSASHRPHASIIGLPKLLPSYAGLEFAEEVEQLSQLFQPAKPLILILGGVKFGTKLPLARRFLEIADQIFIGGALAHSFFKLQGYEIGRSLYDDQVTGLEDLAASAKVILPQEVLVEQGGQTFVTTPDHVPSDGMIVDAGPGALNQLAEMVGQAKTVLWNGPLGNYEQGFIVPTQDLARLIVGGKARSVIGGGDTIAAIEKLNILDRFGFVSTGGGAMLDFLATGTLPGIKALEESA